MNVNQALPLQEICLLRALSYDQNIVQFCGACSDPEVPLLVLEHMQGGDVLWTLLVPNSVCHC